LEEIKLIQGDCLEVMKSIPDKSIDAIICDLPYGTTACKWDSVIPFEPLWEQYRRVIKDNGVLALFAGEPFTSNLICSNIKNFKYRITWDKLQGGGFLNSKKRPLTRVEDICLFSYVPLGKSTYVPVMSQKPLEKIRPHGNRKPCDITTYGKHSSKLSDDYDNSLSHPTDLIAISSKQKECNSINRVHPTQKPIALMEYLIKTYTNEGDIVLDNCMGSGTTGVACKNLGRKFIGIEQDSNYFEIASKRIYE
jgi:site-specific DNA-methyltransferase (adenine-specific)